ncbi:MAG: hypothetical protein HZA24_12205 [Nitrospirae bacterium]|nr:hypothetical protein [Nitrospirota bacterium]
MLFHDFLGRLRFKETPLSDILPLDRHVARKANSPGNPDLEAFLAQATDGEATPGSPAPTARQDKEAPPAGPPNANYPGEVFNPGGYPVPGDTGQQLWRFSRQIGKPVVITGGNRKPDSPLGAGANSQHTLPNPTAIDFYVPSQTHLETANQAKRSGLFTGIGWYQEGYRGPNGEGPHVHVDTRPMAPGRGRPYEWGHPRDHGPNDDAIRIPPFP